MNIILSHSFKGGTGKTIFSTNLAQILVHNGYRVLLIEADFLMPSLIDIYQDFNPSIYFNDYLNQTKNGLNSYIFPNEEEQLGVIFCDRKYNSKDPVHSTDLQWFNKKREQLRADLNKLNYDFILFDLSPGMHLFTVNALSISSHIFLLMRPDYHSVNGSIHLLKNIYSRAIRHVNSGIFVVLNQIPQFNKMQTEISNIQSRITGEFSYVKDIFQINYEPETAYHTSVQKLILPASDPSYEKIKGIADYITKN